MSNEYEDDLDAYAEVSRLFVLNTIDTYRHLIQLAMGYRLQVDRWSIHSRLPIDGQLITGRLPMDSQNDHFDQCIS